MDTDFLHNLQLMTFHHALIIPRLGNSAIKVLHSVAGDDKWACDQKMHVVML